MNLFDDFNLDIVRITKLNGVKPRSCDNPDDGSGGPSGPINSVFCSQTCYSDCICHSDGCESEYCDPAGPTYSDHFCGGN